MTLSRPRFASLWESDLEQLRLQAARNLENEWLERWWCRTYNKPRKDPLLQEYTYEELMVEFLEHQIEKDPSMAYVVREGEKIVMKTGDKFFDAMEDKIAKGEIPTLEELGMPKAMAERMRKQAEGDRPKVQEPPPEEIDESYD